MDFFEKLSKKATETYKNVADKTNKIASESNIKSKMNDAQKKITTIYTEIGKKVYQKYATDGNLDIKEHIQEELNRIDELNREIKKGEEDLLTLSGVKKCVKCNQNVPIDSKFCPSCGVEQPEIVKEEKKDEQPDVKAETASQEAQEEGAVAQETQKTTENTTVQEVATEVETIVEEAVEENKEQNKEENSENS